MAVHGLAVAAMLDARRAGSGALRRRHGYTAEPSLKMGRYIAITMPPISVPSTTMIIGSIRLASASTVSSTSCSKKSATLPSIASSEPASSPIIAIWITMLGNTSVPCMDEVRLEPVETSAWIFLVAT